MEFGLIGVAIAVPCLLLALADRKKIIAAKREEFVEETRNLILTQAQKLDTEPTPCPFCGCEMSIAIRDYSVVKIKHYSIVHPDNGCILENYESCETSARQELVDKWNRRVSE